MIFILKYTDPYKIERKMIRINWDGEVSRYAENPDNSIFSVNYDARKNELKNIVFFSK